MLELPSHVVLQTGTAVIVRWLHVLAMAVVTGGAVLTWATVRFPVAGDPPIGVVVAYEWLFWTGMGVLVMTGIGNLGSLAPVLPRPGTPAGSLLAVKLPFVLLVLIGSVPRTLAVERIRRTPDPPTTVSLGTPYGLTSIGLVGLVAVAVVLAHG